MSQGATAMTSHPIQSFLASLAERRKALGMPWDALVARSQVSRAAVCRLLKDRPTTAAFQTVIAVAEALGVPVDFDGSAIRSMPIEVGAFLESQAERQARKLVSMVQGTMGLESQALPNKVAAPLIQRTKQKLLAGPKKALWYD
jgi:transcriptional regulator with XRE-family HTH domain